MDFHEAASIFPIDDDHLPALADDIKKNGQKVPIEMLDGKVLDGRRRWLACQMNGCKAVTKDVKVADPISYVLSLNLHRRHLNPSQLSMVGARAREMYDEQAKERQKEHGKTAPGKEKNTSGKSTTSVEGTARDAVGRAVGVSGTLIDRATKVIEKGEPELIAAVDQGRLSVSSAASIADESAAVQKRVASEAKFSGGRYRKTQVEVADEEQNGETKRRGVGIIKANEAINCLSRIPKNDALRKRGFQLVTDWIRQNR